MSPLIKSILAVLAGLVVGGLINMGLIMSSSYVIPPPAGVDPTDMESLAQGMHLFSPKHFIMPFLAHALGTLAGALIAARLAPKTHRQRAALVVGVFFFLVASWGLFLYRRQIGLRHLISCSHTFPWHIWDHASFNSPPRLSQDASGIV
ncbi:MAG: hypothetical protein KTR24_01935 [Saprospiraceae bacterium]|nr:hypothetical protein [Saprospiraceae bacterium]